MALTEEEKKIARAYNVGYTMSMYEPRLLAKIIKSNAKNEFVQAMEVGRSHQEFHAGIPKKEFSRDYKNGFYNGRTLAEHDPKMIDQLLTAKSSSKDYKKGLESARKEYSIKTIQQKMSEEKTPTQQRKSDVTFKRGYNIGYELANKHGAALKQVEGSQKTYSQLADGIQMGKQQRDKELGAEQDKGADRANENLKSPNQAPAALPKWFEGKANTKATPRPDKIKGKDMGYEH